MSHFFTNPKFLITQYFCGINPNRIMMLLKVFPQT